MKILSIPETRQFMHRFLLEDTFDSFLFSEGVLTMETTISLEGKLHPDYYDKAELEELQLSGIVHIPWKYMKERVYSLIRGKKTPLSFRFTLIYPPEKTKALPGSDEGTVCLLTIRFTEGKLSVITGISRSTFTHGHELDRLWDDYVQEHMKDLCIIFQEMIE